MMFLACATTTTRTLLIIFILNLSAILSKRVTVIGANGRTGRLLVEYAAARGCDVDAITRTGTLSTPLPPDIAKKVKVLIGDVTQPSSLSGIKSDAVFFCASQSKEGGNAAQVDYQGLVNVAAVCIDKAVPRLVVVSSGAVSKPNSPVYLFLNLFGGIMKQKALSEVTIRNMYANAPSKLGYTFVRPGGLTLEPGVGPSGLELNQKDEKTGRISRYDVAAVCFESISAPSASRVTLECYNKDTGRPLSSVFFSNAFKMTSEAATADGSYQRRGDSWKEILNGLVADDKL